MKRFILFLLLLSIFEGFSQTEAIQNVTASQRTDGSKLIDITYDLTGQAPEYFIQVQVSLDGGASYSNVHLLSGKCGPVAPGLGKTIVWNAGSEYPGVETMDAKVLLYIEYFHECGDPISYAGEEYATVTIGSKCWMKENLNVGSMIQNATDQTDNGEIEKYCYDNDPANCYTYGGIYEWGEAMGYSINAGTRGICPAGWHIPSDKEWKTLEGTIDTQYGVGDPVWDLTGWRGHDAGTNLKVGGNTGFDALLGGITQENADFVGMSNTADFWTSDGTGTIGWEHGISTASPNPANKIYHDAKSIERGYSVRCIRDRDTNTFIDSRDGRIYKTVRRGNQTWMAENLNVGVMIPRSTDPTDNGTIEKFCYNDREENCNVYGAYYCWDEMMDYVNTQGAQGICPDGWHVPTDEEWKMLEGDADTQYGYPDPEWDLLGSRGFDAGGNLKEAGTTHWAPPNTGATNSTGFTALPAGSLDDFNTFHGLGEYLHWWTSTENTPPDGNVFYRHLHYNWTKSRRFNDSPKTVALSIRCLKDL